MAGPEKEVSVNSSLSRRGKSSKSPPRGVSILGATGSIGQNCISVIRENPGFFRVTALAVNRRWPPLVDLALEFQPEVICVADERAATELFRALPGRFSSRIVSGEGALTAAATAPGTDITLCACSGAVGLVSALAAVGAGIDLALANKEVLVAGGELVVSAARRNSVKILPVDSEHSAIFQCIGCERDAVASITLTASGGPFRGCSPAELEKVTVADALKHPNWSMGRKITIDSATLMNKGLEVIEARWLFDVSYDQISVLVHPQSIIHSMVDFKDGSCLAQLGIPDMRMPIHYALAYPERLDAPYLPRLNLADIGSLTFEQPDRGTFKALDLACMAGRLGRTYPTVLNAANEIAVQAFLEERINFPQITELVERVMDRHDAFQLDRLDDVLEADRQARIEADRLVEEMSKERI